MVIMVTAPLHSGKTTFMAGLCTFLNKKKFSVGGYITPAVFDRGERLGYDLLDLQTHHQIPFLRHHGDPGWKRVGSYFFIPEGLEKAGSILSTFNSDVCFIDEIGPMELSGGGVWPHIESFLKTDCRPVVIVVRENLAEDFLPLFQDRDFFLAGILPEDEARARIEGLLQARLR